MMLLSLAAALSMSTPVKASDFFPTTPGLRRTYEEMSFTRSVTTEATADPVPIAGTNAIPVQILQDGKVVAVTYYRVTDTEVSMIANDPKVPFPRPILIFQTGEANKTEFAYDGPSGVERSAERVKINGRSEFKGEREVLGKRVPVLEVHTHTELGEGRTREIIEQDAVYAKGIGLVSLKSVTSVLKKSATSTVRLIQFEPPKGSG